MNTAIEVIINDGTKRAGDLQHGDLVLNLGPSTGTKREARRVLGVIDTEIDRESRHQRCHVGRYVTVTLQGGVTRVVHEGASIEVVS
jgi:hypothetical protein